MAICPFCRIIQQKDPYVREVYRDEHIATVLPVAPAEPREAQCMS